MEAGDPRDSSRIKATSLAPLGDLKSFLDGGGADLPLSRTKMTELTSEISRLTREVEAASEEQGTYLAYDKRVKELAAELTLAQVRESAEREILICYCPYI